MARRARRTESPAFKAKMALAAIEGDNTLAELEHDRIRLTSTAINMLVKTKSWSVTAASTRSYRALARQFGVHANGITTWKAQSLDSAAGLFGGDAASCEPAPGADLARLHPKIGELTLENDFLSGALSKAGLLSVKR